MEKWLKDIFPILEVAQDCILSKQGDITVAYEISLPELFTLSNEEYEALHQSWVKAIKMLPAHSILHKQDWFVESKFKPGEKGEHTFLSTASDEFFKDRPFLEHRCYLYLTKQPEGRKPSSSMFSNLLRPHLIPEQVLNPALQQEFLDTCSQFKQIMEDSGFVIMRRLTESELYSSHQHTGLLEKYCFLQTDDKAKIIRDIEFKDSLKVGKNYCQLYTLAEAELLPSYCGSRINYDKYSSDRTKFSVGFAATVGQLLPCNHIYNQYIIVEDAQNTIKKLESKRLRLQSLSAYSRENAISRDATNAFLNEAISEQRTPVKAHFNVLVWTDDLHELKELKSKVSSAFAQMDAVIKEETVGAAQIFWAGIPGNGADFPLNDTFDTFGAHAACFFNLETGYKDSPSDFGFRMGDRLTGKPVHTDISDWPMKMGYTTSRNKFILGPSGACRADFR